MKGGRSVQRPQIQRDPHPAAADDWVDGSWTVDCICGVNFDDGEEMVNCDDCGVWVHTRCSRYVKGEDLFTCDKCKRKNNTNFNLRNSDNSEETEVAQFLVELPTKTIRLESTSRSNVHVGPAVVRRPVRLWTDVPMADRVHVQGVPGGDPGLFSGLGSGVCSPALWKCTGLVPKKFNFQYREFPCWDEEEDREGDGNEGDKGAGVLFSLSKGNGVAGRSVSALVGMRGSDEDGRCGGKVGVKDVNKWGAKDGQVRGLNFGVKKERSFLRPAVLQSNKRKKDDLGMSNDRSARKKARSTDREVDVKKRSSSASRTAFTSTSDSKTLERYEDRDPTSIKNDSQTNRGKNLRVAGILRSESDGHGPAGNGAGKVKDDFEQIECSSEALSADMSGHDPATGTEHKEGKAIHEVSEVAKNSPTADNIAASALEHSDASRISVKQEGENVPNGNLDDMVDSAVNDVKPPVEHLTNSPSEVKDDQANGDGEMLPPFRQPNVKLEVDDDNSRGLLDGRPALADVKDAGVPTDKMPVDYEMTVAPLGGLPSDDHTPKDVDRTLEAIVDCHKEKGDELSCDPYQVGKEMEHSQGSTLMQMEQSKSGSPTSQTRTTICEERLPSSSSTAMISKSSASENLRSVDMANAYPNSKQQFVSESTNKEEHSTSSVVKDTDRHDMPRKAGKEHQRSSMNSSSRAPNSSKMPHSTLPRTVSDSKDSMPLTSSKLSSVQNSSEASGSQQNECASHIQSKASVKGDKFNLSNTHPPLKANHLPLSNSSAPTSSSTTLSDEELALLLHQELNSSPRVPRVPRVRQAGSLPQLASPTAASMLLKRTFSSGGKDHGSFSRRKNKDVSKDAFRRSHEPDDGAKKTTNRVPSSPDLRRQDSGNPSSRREDGNSLAGANSIKKNVSPTSTSTANSGPSLSTEFNDNHLSSTRNSPRNISDEETGTAGGPVHRTLPGLINDIMSEGRRMTYEELCNAVLPHWHNLRKHNGERYAYSSHSQAVLDCLRNRHEWAQLVDRGPKTNTNRKKRKVDTEESEDNGYGKGRTSKDGEGKSLESQREDFPKGKRKARKRKLALQGKGLKDAKKRRKADSITDDDSGTFITSSEQSLSSEDEIQGGGAGSDGSEASDSSDDGGET